MSLNYTRGCDWIKRQTSVQLYGINKMEFNRSLDPPLDRHVVRWGTAGDSF